MLDMGIGKWLLAIIFFLNKIILNDTNKMF